MRINKFTKDESADLEKKRKKEKRKKRYYTFQPSALAGASVSLQNLLALFSFFFLYYCSCDEPTNIKIRK